MTPKKSRTSTRQQAQSKLENVRVNTPYTTRDIKVHANENIKVHRNVDGSITLPTKCDNILSIVGDDDPAIYIFWHDAALRNTVQVVNARDRPVSAAWFRNVHYPITPAQLKQAIANHLRSFGGGLMGDGLIAPNTLEQ